MSGSVLCLGGDGHNILVSLSSCMVSLTNNDGSREALTDSGNAA